MNVLVTGGAGYVGSVCVEHLLDTGLAVTVFDNLSEGHRSAVDRRAGFIQGDLADGKAIIQAIVDSKCEAVAHFAASSLVGESMKEPQKYFRNNVANGINLLNACVTTGIRKFVFSSTASVYGMPDKMPIVEESPQKPTNPYGESKWIFERMLSWYQQLHGLEYVAFRYFNAAGASERFGEHHRVETHLIPNVLRVAHSQAGQCEIFGTDYPTPDGTCLRDYIHVSDLAQAHALALKPGLHGVFNLGIGKPYSVREVIAACEKVAGIKIKVVESPRRPGDPPELFALAEKAKSQLGWMPRHTSLEDIVRTAWNWHRKHPNGYPD